MAKCSESEKEKMRAYYRAHKEQIAEHRRKQYLANRDQRCLEQKERRDEKLRKNPDAVKQENRRVYQSRRGLALACSNARYAEKKDEILPQRHEKYASDPRSKMIQASKNRAKKARIPHGITKADIVIPSHCPVFGIPLVVGSGKVNDNSPSLDRIIPELGYVLGNIVVVSWRANSIKRNATIAELRLLADFYSTKGVV